MQIGDKLFRFTLLGVNGEKYTNFDFADKYAFLIIVTCNHCPYARAYWNRLKQFSTKYEEDNLAMIAINPNDASRYPEDSYENMQILSKQLNLNFPYLHDKSQVVTKKLGALRTPEAYLFNNKRELVYRGSIDDHWENEKMITQAYLEDAIEDCLDGLEIDFPEIPAIGCSVKWKEGNEPQ